MKMAGLKRAADPGAPPDGAPRPREVFVTSFDMMRLRELIAVARAFGSEGNAAHLGDLETGLRTCKVVEPAAVPRDVITMNSRVTLRRLPSAELQVMSLVFPVDADKTDGALSILSPLGTALLGHRVGDVVEADSGDSPARWEIVELLYQPEAAGDFHR
jgi:regulator of nucleoside diphosphate kinase